MTKKILYVDLDNVIVDFASAFRFLAEEIAIRDGKSPKTPPVSRCKLASVCGEISA